MTFGHPLFNRLDSGQRSGGGSGYNSPNTASGSDASAAENTT